VLSVGPLHPYGAGMTDDDNPTVLERLIRAGISSERAEGHLASGAAVVDGERVPDPDTPAAPPARWRWQQR
jgi:hypothetical protein